MTILLDIAALFALLLAVTLVPVLGLSREYRITREIRAARLRHDTEAVRPPAAPARRAARAPRPAGTRTHRTPAPPHCAGQH